MRAFLSLIRWLRSFGKIRTMKQEIDLELRFHLEMQTAQNIARRNDP